MSDSFERFLELPEQDRRDVFEAAADRLDTLPSYVEKDFWVCLVLDALYNRLSPEHPKLLFKGGTALSKVFGLIQRFSEDIDLVVYRDGLGMGADSDPERWKDLSRKKRRKLFDDLKNRCADYIRSDLARSLIPLLDQRCTIRPDEEDGVQQTLLIEYPTLYPSTDIAYVQPRVKLEAGARSALTPNTTESVRPYISDDLVEEWSFEVGNLHVIHPERTYLEKALILHGEQCGYRDGRPLPTDKHRISRHYYDVAMMTGTEIGRRALVNDALLDDVREHNLIAFPQKWKKFEEAIPGTIRLVPRDELRAAIEKDYDAMQGMMLGEAPAFGWIMQQIQAAEDSINRR